MHAHTEFGVSTLFRRYAPYTMFLELRPEVTVIQKQFAIPRCIHVSNLGFLYHNIDVLQTQLFNVTVNCIQHSMTKRCIQTPNVGFYNVSRTEARGEGQWPRNSMPLQDMYQCIKELRALKVLWIFKTS